MTQPLRHDGVSIARPLWLLAELTYACPLQCPYCSNPTEMAQIGAELTTDDWFKVLREARKLGAAQLGLSGGEPLARRAARSCMICSADGIGVVMALSFGGSWRNQAGCVVSMDGRWEKSA